MKAQNTYGLGRLYKRYQGKEYSATSSVKGTFYLEYKINGIRKREALKTANGEPIKNLRDARREQERLMTPMLKMEKKERLEVIKARLETAEEEYQELMKEKTPPLSLDDMWQAYVDSHEYFASERTLSEYRSKVKIFLKWLQQHDKTVVRMKDVNADIAKAFSLHLLKKNSANTHNKYIMLLGSIYKVLIKQAQMDLNPFSEVRKVPSRRIRAQTNSKRMLTLEELRTIVEQAEGELEVLFFLGIYTGLRLGDCATLRWSEVDFSRRLIVRRPLKTRNTSGKVVKIGMADDLVSVLAKHIPASGKIGFVLPEIAAEYGWERGSVLSKKIQKHFSKCGIETVRPGTGKYIDPETGRKVSTGKRAVTEVGFHSLRHTFVSLHAEAGTPQSVIRDLVGHGNAAMTEIYEHISDETVIKCAGHLPSVTKHYPQDGETRILPDWVRKKLSEITLENWKQIRDELLSS